MLGYNKDFWSFVADNAREKQRDCDEIQLYEQLHQTFELDEDENYCVVASGIDDGVNFFITTPYPDRLPDNIGTLFFNIDMDFDVKVQESSQCASVGERYYEVKLKKV